MTVAASLFFAASALAQPPVAMTGQSHPPEQKLAKADEQMLQRVDDHYNRLQSLRLRYLERYDGMGMQRSEGGVLLLKKPGRMRWTYDQPAGKLFVLDGKNAYFYTPGDPTAQRIPAKQLDDLRSPLRFLLGHTQLKKELDQITVTPIQGGFRIAGVPKGMAARLRQLSLDVTPDGTIQAMKIEEEDGAVTGFSFQDIQENVPASDADFVFKAPANVTIVEGLPPI